MIEWIETIELETINSKAGGRGFATLLAKVNSISPPGFRSNLQFFPPTESVIICIYSEFE